ncbi:MAG TPA: hypothetical protein VIP28_15290 [Nocardioides sp.]
MTDPPERNDLAGDLHSVTDEEWLTAHERLIAEHPELAATGQLDYIYDPSLRGSSLIGDDETDMAAPDGQYEPATDERFHGGGFRG